ncbi:MAG: DUF167 domain-containing protein [Patescibacteria group bacterium]
MLEKYRQILADKGELYLRLKVRPGAPKNELKALLTDETIKINIAAVAENGRANTALIDFLAKEFGVQKSSIRIISGAGDHLKLIKIINL